MPYLRGRVSLPATRNLQKAIRYFEEAVRSSPDFSRAYSGLSDASPVGRGTTKDFSPREVDQDTSEFSRNRAKRICLPSGETSKLLYLDSPSLPSLLVDEDCPTGEIQEPREVRRCLNRSFLLFWTTRGLPVWARKRYPFPPPVADPNLR